MKSFAVGVCCEWLIQIGFWCISCLWRISLVGRTLVMMDFVDGLGRGRGEKGICRARSAG